MLASPLTVQISETNKANTKVKLYTYKLYMKYHSLPEKYFYPALVSVGVGEQICRHFFLIDVLSIINMHK